MAWPEDKTKVKRMQPSPIMQRANRATGRAFHAAADVADKYAGGAGMKQGAAAVANTVAPVVNTIAEDRQRNKMLQQVRNLKIPYGDQAQKLDRWKQEVENRKPGAGNSHFGPASQQSTVALRDQVNRQSLDNPANARKFSATPEETTGSRRARELFTNASFNEDGTWSEKGQSQIDGYNSRRVATPRRRFTPQPQSPYSVQFDPSVSQEARNRFMAQPTAPGTRRVAGRGLVDPGRNREPERKVPGSFGEIMAENWRMKNERQDQARTDSNRRFANEAAQTDIARQKLGLDSSRVGIEGAKAASDIAAQSVTTEAARAGLGNVRATADLEAELLDPATPVERRNQINEILGRTKKPMIQKLKEKDPIEGTEQERLVQIDEQGNARYIDPSGGAGDYPPPPENEDEWVVGETYRSPSTGLLGVWDGKEFKLYGG